MLRFMIPAVALLTASTAMAQDDERDKAASGLPLETFADDAISGTEGEDIYNNVCAGCHMPDGGGAVGAGKYPALANNQQLEFANYPIYIIVNGQKGMPALGTMMSDEQIVEVVNYLQTGLNDFEANASLEQVESPVRKIRNKPPENTECDRPSSPPPS